MRDRRRGGDDANRWLTTYSDTVTLLLCFFVMLFAMSTIDAEKFDQVVAGFQEPFGTQRRGILPADDGLQDGRPPTTTTLPPGATTTTVQGEGEEEQPGETGEDPGVPPLIVDREGLIEVQEALEEALREAGFEDAADFRISERGLVVSIATDDLLFPTGSAVLGEKGRAIVAAVAPAIARIRNLVQVEGHTDNVPFRGRGYDNWDLSADRALAVVRLLIDGHGIDPGRLSATGYASHRPVASNETAEGRAANRRVELVILIDGGLDE
ncbi:MAG: flagellar motor protein MotB [Actinomycetes bacterium]|jgi:chemotaxis protein MotB|nr:MAG: hypothetical protein DIU67_10280 [Actinomycetota bacterium]